MWIIHYQRRAEEELKEAIRYLEGQETGLGARFEAEVHEALERIRENPYIGGAYGRTRFRCWPMSHRFHYVIYYELVVDAVWIMAVAHGSRRPYYWRHRKLY